MRALVALLLVACTPSLDLGAACDLDSDCPDPYVCRHERCRVACVTSRDCGPGLRCVVGGEGVNVCTFDREETCSGPGTCPGTLQCVNAECRTTCGALAICTSAGVCDPVSETCVETRSGQDAGVPSDAPECMPTTRATCSDGLVSRCDLGLNDVARLMTGGETGEVAPLPTASLGPRGWAFDGDPAMPAWPEVAVAISPAGFGVVLQISGDSRALVAHRFFVGDLEGAEPFPVDPGSEAIVRAQSLALAENGTAITGFVLNRTPVSEEASAHRLTFSDYETSDQQPLSPGTPPNATGGRVAIVGGAHANAGTDFPLFYLGREIRTSDGVPVLGAADEDISMSTYRAVHTSALSSDTLIDVSGSGGRVAVARGAGTEVGIWDVPSTPGDGVPAGDLAIYELGARGAPAVALVSGLPTDSTREYLIAVPVAEGPTGYVRFFQLICPNASPCNSPRQIGADLQSRSGRVPEMLRLLPMPGGGFALVVLEPLAGEGHAVYVRLLDANLDPPLVEAQVTFETSSASDDIVAIDASSTRDAATANIVVAALVRDTDRHLDRVMLGGLEACFTR